MQTSLIKQQLQTFLTDGDILSLAKAERSIGFDLIFSTKSKPFCHVVNEKDLLQSIMKITQRFLVVNFPDNNAIDISLQFSVDIMDSRPDWNLLDILYFFKFIRQRQDLPENKIFGNKITPLKLMELTAVYEERKSIARELWHKKETSNQIFGTQEQRIMLGEAKVVQNDTRFADLAKILINKQHNEAEKIYENAKFTKVFLMDLEAHWNEQMELVAKGEITEHQAVVNHNQYRLNYEQPNKTKNGNRN